MQRWTSPRGSYPDVRASVCACACVRAWCTFCVRLSMLAVNYAAAPVLHPPGLQGKAAYLQWREDLKQMHARVTGEVMRSAGYDDAAVAKVRGCPAACGPTVWHKEGMHQQRVSALAGCSAPMKRVTAGA